MAALIQKSVLVAVIMVCVLTVFIAPTIDLPESALRAKQMANNVMAGIASMSLSVLALVLVVSFAEPEKLVLRPNVDTTSVLCTFLC